MPKIIFPSVYLKANVNVKQGNCIRFENAGTQDEKGGWVFDVAILDLNHRPIETKKFQLNKTNFNAVCALYGDNSDKWTGKTMEVSIYKARNPQTNQLVDAVALIPPTVEGGETEEE